MANSNHILNSLFTQHIFKELIETGNNRIYQAAVREYASDANTNFEAIQRIYLALAESHRNEYFFLNTLLNKWLLGVHSPNTATALTQLRIDKSIADFVFINGESVVYEIKSDLDNFDRLIGQISDYFKAFEKVCVVVSEANFEKAESLLGSLNVGIYSLTAQNRISQVKRREPQADPSFLRHDTLFSILNKSEFESILLDAFGHLPDAPPAFYYDACLKMFSDLPMDLAYGLFINRLKKRNQINKQVLDEVPYELKALFYFFNPAARDVIGLQDFLSRKVKG